MNAAPPGHAALRRGRTSIPGQPYLVTFTTRQRQPIFRDLWLARATITGMLHPPIWRHAMLWCWVLMPDHAHLLVQLGERGDLATLMRNLKSNASRCTVPLRSRALWDRGYHERAIRSDESLRTAARYLVANPLRAGLVERVGDYPYWDAVWLQDPAAPAVPV